MTKKPKYKLINQGILVTVDYGRVKSKTVRQRREKRDIKRREK